MYDNVGKNFVCIVLSNVNICPVPLQMSMSARRADMTVTVGLDRAPIHSDRTTAPARRVGRETALLVKVDI